MAVNKVIINENGVAKTLIDLTSDTVTPSTLSEGITAHNAAGERIVGTKKDSGVVFLKHVLCTGKQHINTHIKPNQNTRVVMTVESTHYDVPRPYFGSRKSTYEDSFAFWQINSEAVRSHFGSEVGANLNVPTTTEKTTIDKNGNRYAFGEAVGTNSAQTFQSDYPLYLFALNNGGSLYETAFAGFAYEAEVYDGDNLLARYKPAMGADGVACMYEEISGTYCYSDGEEAFVAGPEEYPEFLDSIGSSGTQYLKTGFMPNGNTRVVMDVTLPSGNVNGALLGGRIAYQNTDYSFWAVDNARLRYNYGNTNDTATNVEVPGRWLFDLDGRLGTGVKGDLIVPFSHAAATFQSEYELYLFGVNVQNNFQYPANMQMHSCKIYDNGALVRYYKPCLDQNGVACGYDVLNGTYGYNAGNGDFQYSVEGGTQTCTVTVAGTYTVDYQKMVDGEIVTEHIERNYEDHNQSLTINDVLCGSVIALLTWGNKYSGNGAAENAKFLGGGVSHSDQYDTWKFVAYIITAPGGGQASIDLT